MTLRLQATIDILGEPVTLLLKNLLFTIIVPGTIAGYLPFLIAGGHSNISYLNIMFALPLFLVGGVIYTWCVWDFASFGRGTPAPIDAPTKLVVRGLYRYSRNPMYVGVLTVILAWVLLFQAAELLFYAAAVAAMFHLFVVFYEEPRLRELFGEHYDAYCSEVGRWFPRPNRLEALLPPVIQKTLWIIFLVILVPYIFLYLTMLLLFYVLLNMAVWVCWIPRGKDTLFVYSESPVWEDYICQNIIPKIEARSIILNWSQRKSWRRMRSLSVLVFDYFGGVREFNPMAIVFRPFRRPKTFRFYQAFKDYKHEKSQPLKKLEREFFGLLGLEKDELDVQ
jgi:protein-S-isoprenylcysteine O-methyltransferase Ste14